MPGSSSRGIFLSYRREDSPYVGLLRRQLLARIPDAPLFTSEDRIKLSNKDYAGAIRETVGSCAALMAWIGPGWVTATGPNGQRLNDPGDFVRLEIQTALERDVRVIPVLVGDATMPRQEELPSELHGLVLRHAFILSNPRSDPDLLVDVIQRVLGEKPDVGRAGTAEPSTLQRGTRWLRGTRTHEDRSVFISFRHELSEMLARSVNDYLTGHRYDTFVALQNLDSGEFPQAILRQIEARRHFVLLLEPGSLDRISKDGDWLRREIAHALAHSRNVVPVIHKGFEFAPDLVLPPDVARLSSFNAVAVPPGYFNEAMEKLRTRFLKIPSNP